MADLLIIILVAALQFAAYEDATGLNKTVEVDVCFTKEGPLPCNTDLIPKEE